MFYQRFGNENFAAQSEMKTHKNIPDRQHRAHFRKSQKVLYHSTLLSQWLMCGTIILNVRTISSDALGSTNDTLQ